LAHFNAYFEYIQKSKDEFDGALEDEKIKPIDLFATLFALLLFICANIYHFV
jgi:hypothetical protein